MFRWFILLFLLGLCVFSAQSQDTIYLTNPSFEDRPGASRPPRGWIDCGFENETPPDVQPTGGFNVTRPAFDGDTYMGMVVRDNDTWEAVTQKLSSPLMAGECYLFSIYLCRSDTYVSPTRKDPRTESSFTTPIKLRIWGGNWMCQKQELLGESPVVSNIDWQKFGFKFEPKANYQYIILEAFYRTPVFFPYNGNILVDNASHIVRVPCHKEISSSPSLQEKQVNVVVQENKHSKKEPAVAKTVSRKEEEKKQERILSLSRENLRKGSVITIERLYFEADSFNIPAECYQVIDEIYEFLAQNDDIIIEIGGHTNSLPSADYCERLSLERARSVANYLSDKGIPKRRIFFKGYGKRKPIADNSTPEGKRKNQRVEIRILYMKESAG